MLNKKYTSFNAINCVHMLRDGLDGTLRYVFFISINADEFTELLTAFYADSGITGYLLDNNSQLVAFSGTEETKTLVCDLFSDKPELLPQISPTSRMLCTISTPSATAGPM
nr:hypothetical protein [uncultured Marvinbryantia sp.]